MLCALDFFTWDFSRAQRDDGGCDAIVVWMANFVVTWVAVGLWAAFLPVASSTAVIKCLADTGPPCLHGGGCPAVYETAPCKYTGIFASWCDSWKTQCTCHASLINGGTYGNTYWTDVENSCFGDFLAVNGYKYVCANGQPTRFNYAVTTVYDAKGNVLSRDPCGSVVSTHEEPLQCQLVGSLFEQYYCTGEGYKCDGGACQCMGLKCLGCRQLGQWAYNNCQPGTSLVIPANAPPYNERYCKGEHIRLVQGVCS